MRSKILAATVPALLLLTSHGASGAKPAPPPSIVNGTTDTGDPSVVEVVVGCTGTVIAPRVVLTAKHCLEGTSLADLAVFFGNDINAPGTTIQATGSEAHPTADIGVIMLASDAPSAPIPVNSEDLAAHIGETVRPVGFGQTTQNTPDDFGLKRQGTTKLDHVDAENMFIGVDPSATWTCYGDSGGPHFMMIGGVEKTVGVTSYGTAACGEPDDAEVRTDPYYDWIMGFVPAAPDAGPGPGHPDAGPGADTGGSDGGCGCAVGGQPTRGPLFAPGFALLAFAFLRRRRR